MKKDIWSNVYYRLNDPVMIRLAMLYVIKYVDFPISSMDLKHVMLDATHVDYFDLCGMIENIKNENYVKVVIRDEINKLDLTDTGRELIDMFEKDLLSSVRQSLRNSADKFFEEEFEKTQVRSSLTPNDSETFYLDLELNDGKTKLMSMSVFAGSRENALKMRDKFDDDPAGLYQVVVEFLRKSKSED